MHALLLVLLAADPRAVLTRAAEAHGGHDRLAALRCERVSLRGSIFIGGAAVGFTNELSLQLPERFKSTVTLHAAGTTAVNVLDGVRAATAVNGRPVPVSPQALADLRQTLAQERALRLVPLLSDPGVALTDLGEYTVEGRPVIGVGVRRTGQRDLKLFFDRTSALLVACEHLLTTADGKTVVHQARYADHRTIGGHIRPGRVTVYRDGQKAMEAEVISAVRVDLFDAKEFDCP